MRAARAHGIPMSVWDTWTVEDRAYALALDELERERERDTCPVCGGPAAECQDKANQRAYEVEGGWCYRTKASLEEMARKTKGMKAERAHIMQHASVIRARLNPARRHIR